MSDHKHEWGITPQGGRRCVQCGVREVAYAHDKGYLLGHASRDPEVAELKIKLLTLTNNAKGTPWTQGEIDAAASRASQTERILELSAEVAKWIEDRDNWIKRFEGLQKELSAEREASRKLVEAGNKMRDWIANDGTGAIFEESGVKDWDAATPKADQ